MKILLLLFCVSISAVAQAVRLDPIPAFTTSGSASPGLSSPILTLPFAYIAVCNAPVNGTPCTNYATTYISASGSACPTSQQVVLAGSAGCGNQADAQGNFGFWLYPGNYVYTITWQGTTFGPYPLTAGVSTGGNNTFTGTNNFTGTNTFGVTNFLNQLTTFSRKQFQFQNTLTMNGPSYELSLETDGVTGTRPAYPPIDGAAVFARYNDYPSYVTGNAPNVMTILSQFEGTTGTPGALLVMSNYPNVTSSVGASGIANYMTAGGNTINFAYHGECDYSGTGTCASYNAESIVTNTSGRPWIIGFEGNLGAYSTSGVFDLTGVDIQLSAANNTGNRGAGVRITANTGTTNAGVLVQPGASGTFQYGYLLGNEAQTQGLWGVLMNGQEYLSQFMVGSGTPTLGANYPGVTATPYTWEKVTLTDGSQGYIPVWK